MGGGGKSQIAIEYAYRIREERPDIWVFWVYASSITRVEEGLREIAEKTQAPGWDEAKADTLKLVSHWLATHGPWVLIIDNVDKMDVVCGPWRSQHDQAGHENRSLYDNLPMTANGSVLITSRSRDVALRLTGDSKHIIQVGSMDLNQAGTLLRKTLTVSASVEDVKTLVQMLDGSPLALTQAAAIINQHYPRMTVSQFLEELQRGHSEQTRLLQRDLGDLQRDKDSSNSIVITLIVSFEHIRQVYSSAARLLAFMSCFDHEAIPVDLLDSYHKDIKIDDFEFDFDLQDDVNVLQAYSLVWVNPTNTFRMHRLVQLSVKKWLEWHDELEGWQERYVKKMAKAFPDGRYENWKQCQILFPHAEAILKYRVERSSFLEPWATVLFCASWYAKEQGWFDKAQEMAEASLQARIKMLGEDHPDTLSSMTNLALTYLEQGQLAKAEELLAQVLNTKQQMLGEEHPDTLVDMSNLASTYREQGRLAEAEELLVQVLKTEKQVLGEEHPGTLVNMSNLALTYREQGRLAEAEELLIQVVKTEKQVLGEEHPDTLVDTSNLASTYREQGRLVEAELLLVKVIEIGKRVLSDEHPFVLRGLDYLASVLRCQGKYARAEAMLRQALAVMERVQGKNHPSTLTSTNNLALVLGNKGMYEEAGAIYRQGLGLREKVLGSEHPDTLTSMNNLAEALSNQGKYEEAEGMLGQTLMLREKVLGPEHPGTLTSMNNLAEVLSNQGKYEEAEAMLGQTLVLREKVLGRDHPATLISTIGLGEILRCRGDYIESEKMLLYALNKQIQALSAESPDIQKGIDSLTSVFIHSSKTQIEFISNHKHSDKYNGMLQIAAVRGSEELVRQLVQKRIQVDFADATHKKALETAANRGHTTVVRLLLEDGAESGSEDAIGNALQAASAGGHQAVVQLLLERGADVDVGGGRYDNALQAASANGHETVVRLLLEKGADVNAGGGRYDNALQAASANGHETVVRLLLEKGADVNARGGRYDNALQAACAGGHEAVVRLLLDKGADVNARGGRYGNALEAASAGDHQSVTRLLTDTALTFSSICDSRRVRDEDETASFSSSATSTVKLALPSTTSARSFLASSVTSLENKLPEEIFKLLTFEVLLDPDMKDLCEKMLKIKGESLFIRLFKREIRRFCSVLYTEHLTEIQKGSIRILRRYRTYFAFRVCQLLKPSTIRKGWQLEDIVDQTVEAGVEKYLQGLRQVDQSPRDDTAVESTSGTGAVETASQDSRNAEDHAGAGDHGFVSVGNKQADDAADDASTFVEDESSASNSLDDELDIIPQSLTKDTISWLTKGVSYRNFKHNITKQICSPLQYVHRVLQPALSASELCSATFHVEWQLIQYTNSELEEGDTLVHALTVSGDIIDAEASSCLEYCRRIWPVTGEFVLITLEKAIKAGWHDSSSSGTTISCHLRAGDVSHSKEKAVIVANGSREDVISVGQQLAWLSAVFRIPNNGKFACSDFIICETPDLNVFNLKLSQLQDIEATPQACWHPLFLNGVLARGFAIKPREGEVGVELPFEAMTFFAGIIGPMEYRGGLVLKGFSTIIFPVSPPPLTTISDQTSVQWHLVYARTPTPIPLVLLSEEHSRALWPLTDLKFLAQGRTFLGCYKAVNIHLGTSDTAYDRIGFSQACFATRKPIFSGFTLGFTMPKFGGPSAAAHFNKPKRQSLTREEHSYEGILSYSSTMPLILYDTSDRRAWMVPALGVILHMIHIWAALQKDSFPTMHFPDLPYANPAWDIGREAQDIIYGNSNLQLYVSKDDNEPYMLKDLVKKYWLELEHAIVAGADHEPSADHLTGWDMMELVTRDPFSAAKKPVTREFKGNWNGLASDPNMVVLLCSGLGEVIVPKTDTQELCNMWKLVPTEQDYLAASVKCILQLSKRFPEPNACSKLGPALFWQPSRDIAPFADCSHDRRSPCHRTQELVRTCIRPQAATILEQQGAIIFGHRRKKLQKRPYQSNLEQ